MDDDSIEHLKWFCTFYDGMSVSWQPTSNGYYNDDLWCVTAWGEEMQAYGALCGYEDSNNVVYATQIAIDGEV